MGYNLDLSYEFDNMSQEEKNAFKSSICQYKSLPLSEQLKILNDFRDIIIENSQAYYKKQDECAKEGHNFTDWERIETIFKFENPYYESGDTIYDKKYFVSKRHDWVRTCINCGYEEKSHINPAKVKKKSIE